MEVLINALYEYRRISKVHKNEMAIWDLFTAINMMRLNRI